MNPIFVSKLSAPPKFSSLCRVWCINVLNWIFVVKLGAFPNLILIALNSLHLWIWSFDPLVVDFNALICYVFILLGSNFVTCIIYGSKLLTNFSNNNANNFCFFRYTSYFPWTIYLGTLALICSSFIQISLLFFCLHILVMLYAINFPSSWQQILMLVILHFHFFGFRG